MGFILKSSGQRVMKQPPSSSLEPVAPAPTAIEHVTARPSKDVPGQKNRPRRGWVWFSVLLLVGAGAYFLWPRNTGTKPGGAKGAAGKAGSRGPQATPVVAAKARKGDIGV